VLAMWPWSPESPELRMHQAWGTHSGFVQYPGIAVESTGIAVESRVSNRTL
jgi:hypothetical protein